MNENDVLIKEIINELKGTNFDVADICDELGVEYNSNTYKEIDDLIEDKLFQCEICSTWVSHESTYYEDVCVDCGDNEGYYEEFDEEEEEEDEEDEE